MAGETQIGDLVQLADLVADQAVRAVRAERWVVTGDDGSETVPVTVEPPEAPGATRHQSAAPA